MRNCRNRFSARKLQQHRKIRVCRRGVAQPPPRRAGRGGPRPPRSARPASAPPAPRLPDRPNRLAVVTSRPRVHCCRARVFSFPESLLPAAFPAIDAQRACHCSRPATLSPGGRETREERIQTPDSIRGPEGSRTRTAPPRSRKSQRSRKSRLRCWAIAPRWEPARKSGRLDTPRPDSCSRSRGWYIGCRVGSKLHCRTPALPGNSLPHRHRPDPPECSRPRGSRPPVLLLP